MIGRSGLFADIMCPYDEDCIRPHCHFWHSKDDISQQEQQSSVSLMSATLPEQPFVGYVGYMENQKTTIETTMPLCSQSIYAPLDPVVYTQRPSTSAVQQSSVTYVPTKITARPMCKRMPSPEIPKPRMPVELSVDDILDPANDKPKTSVAPSINNLSLIENTKVSEMSLNDYAKSVADIDTRIEELQRKIEIERQQKEKIVHDIRALVKPPAAVNSDSLTPKKHSGLNSKSKLTYTGGYTPTPIALLKSVQKAKNEARQKKKSKTEESDNEKEDVVNLKNKVKGGKMKDKNKNVKVKEVTNVEASKLRVALKQQQSTEGKTQSVAKKKLDEQLSIEDLFETGVPATKKQRNIDNDVKSKAGNLPEKMEKQKEIEIKMEVEKRITHSSVQPTIQMCVTATKVRAPTMAQQLMNRYQKLQKEKEELLKNMKLKEEVKAKKITTAEEKYDYKLGAVAATLGKGEKRMAHAPKISKSTKVNLVPLDPYSCGKVPYALRARYLSLFYIECQKFCGSMSDAVVQAQQEEKTIKDRAVTKGGYTSAAVNVLRRLRDVNSPQVAALKSVSHSAILAGRHHGSITVGQRKYSAPRKQSVSESEFYGLLLSKFVLDEQKLEQNGFPLWEGPDKKRVKIKTSELDCKKKLFVEESDLKRICCRCGAEFSVTPKGEYAALKQCVYHWGKAFKTKTRGLWESRYNCCQSDLGVAGCCVADCHVTDTAPKSVLETYRETPPPSGPKDERSRKVYAFDCEMVYTTWGTSLARISVVDVNDKLVMDVIVRQQYEVRDCNTRFSGLTIDQIEGAEFNLEQTQKRFFELVNSETILIGHSLESDLKAMRLVHHRVVDTSVVFPHRLGPPYKRALKTIASEILQLIIQEDIDGHDSKEDASTCMRLMLYKVMHN
ncbi:exonuclease [Loa loa]|uniref:Exonuclease n=3 Tax=Loa loa TaxID=7209 RepID=A0A1S0UKC5_LOALO|nr:exonuclease [Loa loa]EJD76039.1 exonuclease [Loa loa]